jgi:hypothetical protein
MIPSDNVRLENFLLSNETPVLVGCTWALLIGSLACVFFLPWQHIPIHHVFVPNLDLFIYNLKEIRHLRGNFPVSLWGYLVFLGMSMEFVLA